MLSAPFLLVSTAAGLFGLLWLSFHMALRWTHVLQQCSYQNPSYRRWLRENRAQLTPARRWAVLPAAVLALVLPAAIAGWCAFALALFQIWLNPARHGKSAKKPLVFTARVKRLLGCEGMLAFLVCALTLPFGPAPCLCALAVFACLTPFLAPLCNALNGPLERRIAQRYIDEARRIVRGIPGLTVIGITGSFGKTSTKHYLYALLSAHRHVYMTPGNFNTTLGVTRAIREGLLPTHQIFLCEMGARHVHDIAEICELVRPDMGVITAIGEQHLETFGSLENIARTKLELYQAVRQKGGETLLNWDCAAISQRTYEGGIVRCGSLPGCDYRLTDVQSGARGSAFTVTAPDGESARFETRLLGRANLQDIALAIAAAHRLGIALDALRVPVAQLQSVAHRLELKSTGAYTLIDDAYNSNPQGAAVALETLSAFPAGGRIVITPGLVELGEREKPLNFELGQKAAACCDFAVLIGQRQAPPIRDGLLQSGFPAEKITVFDDVRDGLAYAASLPGGQDRTVLLLNDLPDNYK